MRDAGFYWVRYRVDRLRQLGHGEVAVAYWNADYRDESNHGAWEVIGHGEHWPDHVCEVIGSRLKDRRPSEDPSEA